MASRAHRLLGKINAAKRRAEKEGRSEDPDFLDWLDAQYEELDRESSRSYRWYGNEIQLGKGQFGC